ncbi:MAG: SHOCT domain-containing protein [Chloroflexi bacterium]|nr:SHOCT domain-containing protein [Chloroflexota bacterium]
MWRRKKLVIVAVLAAVVLVGSIGGIALANNGDDSQPEAPCTALLDRVCEIYEQKTGVAIDPEVLRETFTQVRGEMHPEGMPNRGEMDPEALQNHLQDLFDQGKITEEQYEHMKDRIESMPDNLPGFGFRGHGGFRGFGGPCAPAE